MSAARNSRWSRALTARQTSHVRRVSSRPASAASDPWQDLVNFGVVVQPSARTTAISTAVPHPAHSVGNSVEATMARQTATSVCHDGAHRARVSRGIGNGGYSCDFQYTMFRRTHTRCAADRPQKKLDRPPGRPPPVHAQTCALSVTALDPRSLQADGGGGPPTCDRDGQGRRASTASGGPWRWTYENI